MRILKTGLTHHAAEKATKGLTLLAPAYFSEVFLLDMSGNIAHRWSIKGKNGCLAQLLENGNLLVCEESKQDCSMDHGRGGFICEYDWDSNLVWEHIDHPQHHDVRRLPNGNTLYIGWELMTGDLASRVKGGRPGTEHPDGGIWSDYLREVTPLGESVWEWHHWDEEIENYPLQPSMNREELGHVNSCYPFKNGDVLISMHRQSTISIVDRKTRRIRWEQKFQEFGTQHDVQVLENGNYLLFANGLGLGPIHSSRVIELDPQSYEVVWEYKSPRPLEFYSPLISGCQRLQSGNTLICEGMWGRIFEITRNGEIVWEYISPYDCSQPEYGTINWIYRAYRYAADSPQIQNRI